MDNNWITLKGYNKMADNTFPNIMAILTGYNESSAFNKCDPTILNMLDYCPMIWNDFRKFGYVTAFAEDESWISTFNCNKKGFNHQPTDYYFRPYFLKTESFRIVWKDDTKYCTGPEPAGERLLNVIKEFGVAFLERPSFGFFWTNSFSHNSLNAASGMDDKIKQFFEDITNAGILENSIVIFLSDHGLRCGEFRETTMGWLEERLPFIYIWIPEKFQKKFPAEFTNIKRKVDKLTSPFDLYMTLQHLLVLSDFNYVMKPSSGCSNCKSLFIETGSERSCEDAGIAQHWCTCADFSPVDGEVQKIVNKASYYFTEQINGIIHNNREGEKCAAYSFHKIVKTGVIKSYKDEKYLLLAIETKPKAFFETTLAYHKHENEDEYFEIKGGISRTDRYAPHSQCTQDTILKKYCHCKLNNTNI
ncbi:DUF229 and/or Sulfatase domain containing protein [Asbolus verrucosus]|uniref:DUF229 and/or Sulfatase domain containing protein n=1 Tax=Asbolus verrucosus TaxID=1661398 RepID=A0A482W7N1_ASBVE|nr:DUF229 and/or Sulfatase domain containing protein [Asbolus verrucosus]